VGVGVVWVWVWKLRRWRWRWRVGVSVGGEVEVEAEVEEGGGGTSGGGGGGWERCGRRNCGRSAWVGRPTAAVLDARDKQLAFFFFPLVTGIYIRYPHTAAAFIGICPGVALVLPVAVKKVL
jgi:hypothetical protein